VRDSVRGPSPGTIGLTAAAPHASSCTPTPGAARLQVLGYDERSRKIVRSILTTVMTKRKQDETTARIRKAAKEGRIEFAPADRIDDHREILEEFMWRIFEFEPGSYALSDESLVSDMTGLDGWDDTVAAVKHQYGIDLAAEQPQPYLWEVIARIAALRRVN
jgi:hypothetical protein